MNSLGTNTTSISARASMDFPLQECKCFLQRLPDTEQSLTHATVAGLHKLESAPLTDETRTIRGGRRQADMRALTGDTGSRGHLISTAVDSTSAQAGLGLVRTLRNNLRRARVWHNDSDHAKRLAVQDCAGAAFLRSSVRCVVPEACGTVWGIIAG
jgi:hypothetical protein